MLYIIRHGKTDWNALHKLQGKVDIPLNDEGRAMAHKAAAECRDVHFDVCFVSPLCRACETAEILLKDRNVPIIKDERLREMDFGKYEGELYGTVTSDLPIEVLFRSPENYKAEEGCESLESLFARTGEFLREKVYPLVESGKDVLIVGHGAMNSSIMCQVKNVPVKDFWSFGLENCRLMKLM